MKAGDMLEVNTSVKSAITPYHLTFLSVDNAVSRLATAAEGIAYEAQMKSCSRRYYSRFYKE